MCQDGLEMVKTEVSDLPCGPMRIEVISGNEQAIAIPGLADQQALFAMGTDAMPSRTFFLKPQDLGRLCQFVCPADRAIDLL